MRTWTRTHPTPAALTLILATGFMLRLALTFSYVSAFTGYSDSGVYFQDSVQSVWTDPIRTVGYSMFLRLLHAISPHILLVVIVQHGLGLGAAALLYLTVRRAGGPRWLGLIPAAALAFSGDEIFIEHSALSETPFIFLLAATLYTGLRATQGRLRKGAIGWAAAAGVCAGLCVWDRAIALVVIVVLVLWLLFHTGRPNTRVLALAATALIASVAVVGFYVEWRDLASGHAGLTTNGAWNLYGRVAPWADCKDFTPPPGTQALCESTAPRVRGYRSSEYYIYGPQSPAIAAFGPVYLYPADPKTPARLQAFAEAAIVGEPFQYLRAVGLDAERLIDPNRPSYGDLSANAFYSFLLYGPSGNSTNAFVSYWQTLLYPHDPTMAPPHVGALSEWEGITRLDGVLMVFLLCGCVFGPMLVPPGPPRSNILLFSGLALTLLLAPIFTKGYDYRFVIPALGPLFAAAALGGWGVYTRAIRIRSWVRTRQKKLVSAPS